MNHHWKLFIAIVVVMLALTGVWLMTGFVSPSDDVEVYRKSLIEKGEKLQVRQVMPLPVSSEQNGVDVLDQAIKMFVPVGDEYRNFPQPMHMVAPGSAMVAFEQLDLRYFNFTNSWSGVMDIVKDDRPAMEALEQITNYPAVDFHVDYEKISRVGMPFLGSLWRAGQRLSGEAIVDLHEGDAASATAKLQALLALVNGARDVRLPIFQQIRMSQAMMAVGVTWEVLQSSNVDDEELAGLQKDWERQEFVYAGENEFLMRRALSEAQIIKIKTSNDYFNQVFGKWPPPGTRPRSNWEDFKQNAMRTLWKNVWIYDDELRMLQNDQVVLDAFRAVETTGVFYPAYTNMAGQLSLLATNQPRYVLGRLDTSGLHRFFAVPTGLGGTFENAMRVEAAREMVIAAIALKRYELKHGKYPPGLDLLVPEFISKVPRDPMDGKPLRYRLDAGGSFLLYSIGENGMDDRGNPSGGIVRRGMDPNWLDNSARDWVWPQPASAAEIEHYLAHP